MTDPSVLFWNFANRANKLYKAMEYEMAIATYEKSFALLEEVFLKTRTEERIDD